MKPVLSLLKCGPRHAAVAALGLLVVTIACSAEGDRIQGANEGTGASGGSGDSELDAGLGVGPDGALASACTVSEEGQDGLPCERKAPPGSFSPVIQWTWTAPKTSGSIQGSIVTPLVGNFTDDNGDGSIDLCDIPDIVVVTIGNRAYPSDPGAMYLLSGDTGQQEIVFDAPVDGTITPAFADIDQDGLPEVVTIDPGGRLIAFEHTGSVKWIGDAVDGGSTASYCSAISIYDLDGDGHAEIIAPFSVYDDTGHPRWGQTFFGDYACPTSTAADLDGDGKLEVLFGNGAFRHDGSVFWQLSAAMPGQPHVANFDDDPEPEILFTSSEGLTVVEHDGTLKYGPVRPTNDSISAFCWGKPAAIHDFDGDGTADVSAGSCIDYSVYLASPTAMPLWSAAVEDLSGLATGSAFDFLGDGVADALYADEHEMYAFDGATGNVEMTIPRESGTLIEYPVVGDVDNDGSAEIVVVSNWGWFGPKEGPTVTVIRDAEDRWVPARRIWNQHAYHVTNIREDGRLPAVMNKSWQVLNTFRTNSQIEGLGSCLPPPAKPK